MMKRMLTAVGALATGVLFAGTGTWTGGAANNFWYDPNNWTGDCASGVPGAGDTAVFDSEAGGTVAIQDAGVTLAQIAFTKGVWTLTGGRLTLSGDTPFALQQADPVEFACPVHFASTSDKTIYGGKIYRNAVTAAGGGRIFFQGVAGVADFLRQTRFAGAGCVADLTGPGNVCAGRNTNTMDDSGHLFIEDGASVTARRVFDFAYGSITVSNATLRTTDSGTTQSLDLCSPTALNVYSGGQVDVLGKLDIGQSKTTGTVTMRIEGGQVAANNLVVTRVQSNVDVVFAKAATGTMGRLKVASWGTVMGSDTFGFRLEDATSPEPGTIYDLITDTSKLRTLNGYAVTKYNATDAGIVGNLSLNDGLLAFTIREADFVWTGLGGDGKFSTAANWFCNRTPTGGEDLVFKKLASATTVENDLVDFRPNTITIQGSCTGGLTFTGNAISGVAGISNQAPIVPVFDLGVAFADQINLYCTSANVDFAGGVTGTEPGRLCELANTFLGNYTLTKSTDEGTSWKPPENNVWTFTVPSGSTLSIPGTNYIHNCKLTYVIEDGAVMNVGTMLLRDSGAHFLVKGTLNVGFFWSFGWAPSPFAEGSTGVVNAQGVGEGANQPLTLNTVRVNVGERGIFSTQGYETTANNRDIKTVDGLVLGALADWTYYGAADSPYYKLELNGTLTLDTTDAVDGTTPRTIRFEGPVAGDGRVKVVGAGVFDLSAYCGTYTLGSALEPAAGTTLRLNALGSLKGGLVLPETGEVAVELASDEVLPRGLSLTLFADTGLASETALAERLRVSVPGDTSVAGVLRVTPAGDVVWEVTESDAEAAALTWRPTEDFVWSGETVAWTDAAGAATTFRPFSSARFDGTEAGAGEVAVPADVMVGDLTFTGEKDYTLTGEGRLVGSGNFAVLGGTVTLDGPELTYQPIVISNALVRLGEHLTPSTLGGGGTVTILEGGALDVNQVGDVITNESIHAKSIWLCGAGPDGLGALRNSTVAASPTPYLLSELHLTGDTTIAGPGRLDLRPLARSVNGKVAADMVFEGPDTATLTVTGQDPQSNWGFNLNNCPNATIGRVVVDAGIMTIDAATVLRCPNGLTLKNGGVFYGYALTHSVDFDITVGEGGGSFSSGNGAITSTGRIVVPAGVTLKMKGPITHTGPIENNGIVEVTGDRVAFTGEITGTGTFSGVRVKGWELDEGGSRTLLGRTSFEAEGFVLSGGTVRVGGTFTAPEVPNSPQVDFGSGRVELVGDLVGDAFRPTIAWGRDAAGEVTLDLGTYKFVGGALQGKSDVHVVGAGPFTTDSRWQNAVDGRWTIDVPRGEAAANVVNLSGASAFRKGLTLGTDAVVQLNIGGGGTRAVEFAIVQTEDWNVAKAYTDEYPNFVTHLKMLHLKSDTAPMSTVGYLYRGKFLVAPEQAGMWYFGGVYDDRLLLEIDGEHVLETVESGTPASASADLAAGWHSFRVVVWDNTGRQGPTHADWGAMALGWSTVAPADPLKDSSYNRFDTSTLEMSPMSTFWLSHRNSNDGNTWLTFDAWEEVATTNTLKGINHYGEDSEMSLFNSHLNMFTGRFYVSADQAGVWTLKGRYDDNLNLKIDGEQVLLVNDSASKPQVTYTAAEGWHDFELRTNDGSGHFGPQDQAGAILVTLPGGETVPFDEGTFDFTIRSLDNLAVPGLFGDVVLGAGSELRNGSAFPPAVYPDAFCPVYGTVFGPGRLVGAYRFLGGRLGVSGDGRAPSAPAYGGDARADMFTELGGVDCRFTTCPAFETLVIGPACGLTHEQARELPVTVTCDALTEAAAARYARALKLRVSNDTLILYNPLGAATMIILR